MDKLKQIETFVNVVAKGSLVGAAKTENLAPAVVGRRLDALEERLGVKLLIRTTRKISLTHEGSAFLEDCQRILSDLHNAEASVSAGGVKAAGHLRITAPAGFGRRHVAPLVPLFHQRHPEVTISLNLSDRIIDITSEAYDCAVRIGDMPDSSLVQIRLANNRRICVASPQFIAKYGTPKTPEDLIHFPCLILSSDASQTKGWAFRDNHNIKHNLKQMSHLDFNHNKAIYIKPNGPIDCSDGQVLHDWCLQGYGIAWRSSWEVEQDIATGLLQPLLEDFSASPNGIYAVLPQRQHLALRVRLWLDFLKEHYSHSSYWKKVF